MTHKTAAEKRPMGRRRLEVLNTMTDPRSELEAEASG